MSNPREAKYLCSIVENIANRSFYLALAVQDWQEVVTADNVDVTGRIMEDKISSLMDKCMPLRFIRMSSRDPNLVRSILRAKTRISLNNRD